MTDDKLRKYFLRKNWEVGKKPTSHRCPNCKNRPAARPTVSIEQPPAPSLAPATKLKDLIGVPSPLDQAWQISTDQERREFWQRLCRDPAFADTLTLDLLENFTLDLLWLRCTEQQRNEFLKTTGLRRVALPQIEITEAPPDDDESEQPADWWAELNAFSK